jgi:superfamily I DNA/RNA helicase
VGLTVSCARTTDVQAMLTLLKQRRIVGRDLTAYKGRTTRAVKVGTYHRAKGLEFKEVYLPHVSAGLVPSPAAAPTRPRPRSWPAASSSSA